MGSLRIYFIKDLTFKAFRSKFAKLKTAVLVAFQLQCRQRFFQFLGETVEPDGVVGPSATSGSSTASGPASWRSYSADPNPRGSG